MSNPIGTFRWFYDVAGRRPKLVSVIGLGLLVEATRVWIGLDRGAPVTLLGHGGFETLDPVEDEGALVAYSFWVAFCGALLLVLTWRARRSMRRAAPGAPPATVAPTSAARSGGRAEATRLLAERPPVVRRMRKTGEVIRR